MSYSSTVLADSPYVFHRHGEASGTSMVDSSGAGRNGTYQNQQLAQAGLLTGDSDTCVRFQQSFPYGNAFGTTAVTTAVDGVSQLTLETWRKGVVIGNNDYSNLVGRSSSNTSRFALCNGGAGFGENTGFYIPCGNGADSRAWSNSGIVTTTGVYHLAVVFDGTQTGNANRLKLYVNGVQQTLNFNANAVPATIATNGLPLKVGDPAYDGYLDETAVYLSALSAARVLAHYNAGTSSGTVAQRAGILTGGRMSRGGILTGGRL